MGSLYSTDSLIRTVSVPSTTPLHFYTEPTLELDNFKSNKIEFNLNALTIRLQNMILTEPGTLPNFLEFGLGIELYMFELNLGDTILNIKNKINLQLEKFFPTAPIDKYDVYPIPQANLPSTSIGLMIGFQLYDKGGTIAISAINNKKVTTIKSTYITS